MKRIYSGLSLLLIIFFAATSCSTIDSGHEQIPSIKVLFTGDSITKGELGCSFFELLSDQYPDYELVNLGKDGDTVSGIMNRTIDHLESHSDYDLIVISAGHNDIILPEFKKGSIAYRSVVSIKNINGSIPAESYEDFMSTYERFIDEVQHYSSANIVIMTLSCLNENLNASTNKKRELFNQGIRKLSSDKSTGLADVSLEFNRILSTKDCRDYFMSDLMESAILDRSRTRSVQEAAELSEKRMLHLTIDGIHVNPEGAEIYSSTLSPFLDRL